MGYWLLRGIGALLSLVSFRRIQGIGTVLGLIWFYLIPIRRRTVLSNLLLAFPEKDRSERCRIAQQVYVNTGKNVLELLAFPAMEAKDLLSRVRIHNFERYESVFKRGRGVIVITGHFGNFDLLACSQALNGVPLAIISKQLHDRSANRVWMNNRKKMGLHIFYEKKNARQVIVWLRRGNVLGLVCDQRTSAAQGGILSPFFGRNVWTPTTAAKLALRTGSALLPVISVRGEDGCHDIHIGEEIQWSSTGSSHSDIQSITDVINSKLEKWVADIPENWMWLHKRFNNCVK